MCCFEFAKLVWEREVPKDKPLTAYKAMKVDSQGFLASPIRRTHWKNRELHAHCYGAKDKYGPGIHCMYSVTGASEHAYPARTIVVRVSMWGKVYRYKGDKFTKAGYLAQHVRIEAIRSPIDSYYSREVSVEKALKRYPALLDERSKK